MKVEFRKKFANKPITSIWEVKEDRDYTWPEMSDCSLWFYHPEPRSDFEDRIVLDIEADEHLCVEYMLVKGSNAFGVELLDETANVSYHMRTDDFVKAVMKKRVSDARITGPFKLVKKQKKYSLDIAWE